jgi:hypothetical protein
LAVHFARATDEDRLALDAMGLDPFGQTPG